MSVLSTATSRLVKVSDLPDDMLIEVFARLPAASLPGIERVNRMWRRCVDLALQHVESIAFSSSPVPVPSCCHFSRRVMYLDVDRLELVYQLLAGKNSVCPIIGPANVDQIVRLLKRCPRVKALDLTNVVFDSLECLGKLIEACPLLECLGVGIVPDNPDWLWKENKCSSAAYIQLPHVISPAEKPPIKPAVNLRPTLDDPDLENEARTNQIRDLIRQRDLRLAKINDDWRRFAQRLSLVHLRINRLDDWFDQLIPMINDGRLRQLDVTCAGENCHRIRQLNSNVADFSRTDLALELLPTEPVLRNVNVTIVYRYPNNPNNNVVNPDNVVDHNDPNGEHWNLRFLFLIQNQLEHTFRLTRLALPEDAFKAMTEHWPTFDKLKMLEIRGGFLLSNNTRTVNLHVLETLKLQRCKFDSVEQFDRYTFNNLETLLVNVESFDEDVLRQFFRKVNYKLKKLAYQQRDESPFPEHSFAVLNNLSRLTVDVNILKEAQVRSLTKVLDVFMQMSSLTSVCIACYFPSFFVLPKCFKKSLVVAIAGLRWSLPKAFIDFEMRFNKSQFDGDEAVGEVFEWSFLISEHIKPVEISQEKSDVWCIDVRMARQ